MNNKHNFKLISFSEYSEKVYCNEEFIGYIFHNKNKGSYTIYSKEGKRISNRCSIKENALKKLTKT